MSPTEISWVQTSYLIAEVVMIPLSGFCSQAFSTRYFVVVSAAGFTVMSIMCALSNSIEEMIICRALQGFLGGGMIPTVFASAMTAFPRTSQPIKRMFLRHSVLSCAVRIIVLMFPRFV